MTPFLSLFTVNFCVVYVDKSLKPFSENATVSILAANYISSGSGELILF